MPTKTDKEVHPLTSYTAGMLVMSAPTREEAKAMLDMLQAIGATLPGELAEAIELEWGEFGKILVGEFREKTGLEVIVTAGGCGITISTSFDETPSAYLLDNAKAHMDVDEALKSYISALLDIIYDAKAAKTH